MGSFFSGPRGGSTHDTADSKRRLDVRRLHRDGCLEPGWAGNRRWKNALGEAAAVSLYTEEHACVLSYRYRHGDGPWVDVAERVRLSWFPCHLGGHRRYFQCPGCDRRVAILYDSGARFRCRSCLGLTYESQRQRETTRAHFRCIDLATRIRRKLDGKPGLYLPLPERPKGMHMRTFLRLFEQLVNAILATRPAAEKRGGQLEKGIRGWMGPG